jgi:hypothetical protein
MVANVASLVCGVSVAFGLLLLPGLALLQSTVRFRSLGFLCRFTIAPGITIAVTVLLFVWCDLLHIRLGPLFPWLMCGTSAVVLVIVNRRRLGGRFSLPFTAGINLIEWSAGMGLIAVLAIFFAVRFRATC